MSYQVRPSQNLAKNLRRISTRQVDSAIEASQTAGDDGRSPVHQTRKHLKKARAALAMMRPAVGDRAYKEAKTRLQTVAHLLSELRDAEVRADTVGALSDQAPPAIAGEIAHAETLLQFELESFRAAFDDWPEQAGRQLERVRRRIRKCNVDALSEKRLHRMLEENYREARKSLRIASKKGNAEVLHEFRKRAKTLMYQMRILTPLNPVVFAPFVNGLRALCAMLGRVHDLAFVETRLDKLQPRGKRKRRQQIDALIEHRSGELEQRAVALSERIFADTPKAFGRRLRVVLPPEPQMELSLLSKKVISSAATAA